MNEETSGVETCAVGAPRIPGQIELETVTFTTIGVVHGRTRKIVLQYAGPQHLFISETEVDEAKIACAFETDAGETGGRRASNPVEASPHLFEPPTGETELRPHQSNVNKF